MPIIFANYQYAQHMFLLFFMGCLLTVGSIERTLKAGEGKWAKSGFYALMVSLSTWYSLKAVASDDCISFAAFSAGTIVASAASGKIHKNKMSKQQNVGNT